MYKNVVTELGEMKFKEFNKLDNSKEVCINAALPKSMEIEQNLSDYFISVMFHKENGISVLVYEYERNDSAPIGFTPEIKNELIKFAKKHPQYLNAN